MGALILTLLLIWLVLSVLGLVFKGLFWLFVIGAILFLGTAALGWIKRRSGTTP
jgi:type IV secretory pathway TrbL component